jgi:hypothetical protein
MTLSAKTAAVVLMQTGGSPSRGQSVDEAPHPAVDRIQNIILSEPGFEIVVTKGVLRMSARRFVVAALLAGVAGPGLAQQSTSSASPAAPSQLHGPTDPEIIVTAPYSRDRKLVATAVTVLQGDALLREMRSTIGETLARQPGVSSTFFGPNASRPILRGLDLSPPELQSLGTLEYAIVRKDKLAYVYDFRG